MKRLTYHALVIATFMISTTLAIAHENHDTTLKEKFPSTLTFDNQQWKIDNADKNETMLIVEYTTDNQSVHDWTRLLTYQELLHKLPSDVSTEVFARNIEAQIKQLKLDAKFTIIESSESGTIFEFQIMSPKEHIQDEIQRITLDKDGHFYVIHYVEKKSDMGDKTRKEWIQHLKDFQVPLRK